MKINELFIEDMTPTFNYRWARAHYQSENFLEKLEIEQKGNNFTLDAVVNDYYYNYTVTMSLNYDKDRLKAKCSCRYNTGGQFCGHIAGVLMAINIIEPTTFPYHDNGHYAELIREIKEQERIKVLKKQEKQLIEKSFEGLNDMIKHVQESITQTLVQQDEIHIYTECQRGVLQDYDRYDDDDDERVYANHLLLRFKIGTSKMFVVKNVTELLRRIDYNEVTSYGKSASLKHDLALFDPFSKEAINLMKTVVGSNANIGQTRDLIIAAANLDYFFDLYKDADDSFINIEFSEVEATVKIKITAIETSLYCVALEQDFIYSTKYLYHYKDNRISRLISPQNEALTHFVELINAGYFTRLNQEGFKRLLSIVSSLSPYVECDMDFEFQSLSFETKTMMYIDLEGEDVIIKMECLYEDDTIKNAFDEDAVLSISTQTLKDHILSLGLLEQTHVVCPLHVTSTEQFLYEEIEKIRSFCEIYISESIKKLASPRTISITMGVKTKNNLLEVDLSTFDFDIKELKDIILAYQKKKKYFQLKNGEVIHLEQEAVEQVNDTLEQLNLKPKDLDHGSLKLPLYRAFELNAMKDTATIQLNRQKSFTKLIDSFNQTSDLKIHEHYHSILREYQKEGVEWLMKLTQYGFGGILADDMGLGKTLQIIALLESVHLTKHCLVVCPAVLLYNWQDEVAKFSNGLNCVVVAGSQGQRTRTLRDLSKPTLIITTYDYMRADVSLYESIEFQYMIIDEAQYIKNHITKSAKAIKQIKSQHKIALTGTPIENALSELWSIFDFMMPGYLFDYGFFQKYFERRIIKDENEKIQDRLKRMVEPFILRRTKKEVLKDLPDKIEHVLSFKFNKEEQQHYLAKMASFNDDLKQQLKLDKVNKIAIFSMLTQLRQICCDSRLLFSDVTKPSSKLQGTIELVETLLEANKRILIFSGFTSMLELIEKELTKKYISFMTLTGSVSKEKRKEMVDRFQKGDVSVFLISLKAGGVGLNLTQANVVIHYDPWWNLSAQNQATDRAYRIGQQEDVQVFKLIMKDSIEEKILKMQERKQALSNVFIENSEGSITKMDVESIMSLFSSEVI